jgi:hypothetical protein
MAWAVALLGIKMEGCLRQAPPQSVKLILVQVGMPVGSRTLSMLFFFFIHFPAQSVPKDAKGSAPHRHSLLLSSHPGGGVITPRASGDLFLEGKVLFIATVDIHQHV